MILALAPTGPEDFAMFWFVGQHPAQAYDPLLVHTGAFHQVAKDPGWSLPFFYPPPFLLALAPLRLLPLAAAKALWSGVWCAAFAGIVSRDTRWATPALTFSLPLLWGAAIGQTGLMIATLIIAAFQRLESRPRLAGVLLALVACTKPQALLLSPVVLWGRWETVKAVVASGLALCAASLVFGPWLWIDWVHVLPKFADLVEPTVPKVSPGYLFHGLWWRIALGTVGVAFAWRQRDIVGLLVGTLLCTPYVQLYDLAGFSYLGARMLADARKLRAATVLFAVVLVVCPAWPILTTVYCAVLIGLSLFRYVDMPARLASGAVPQKGQ